MGPLRRVRNRIMCRDYLFVHSLECYFGVYVPRCFATQEMNTKITLSRECLNSSPLRYMHYPLYIEMCDNKTRQQYKCCCEAWTMNEYKIHKLCLTYPHISHPSVRSRFCRRDKCVPWYYCNNPHNALHSNSGCLENEIITCKVRQIWNIKRYLITKAVSVT